ncbi:MAG: c-type cytochrome [Solirubrobacteraceae bacterium]
MSRRLLPMLVACGVAVSACGGGHRHAAASSGHALFSQACGACHTLTGHNDPRHQGGDLRDFHSSHTQLLQLAAEMPVRRPLSRRQLEAVVRFVSTVEAGRS